jgi:hypothetical protein
LSARAAFNRGVGESRSRRHFRPTGLVGRVGRVGPPRSDTSRLFYILFASVLFEEKLIKSDESDFVGATPRLVSLTSRRRPDATPRTDESLPPDESGRLSSDASGTSTVGQVCRGVGATQADGSTRLIHVRKATLHARRYPAANRVVTRQHPAAPLPVISHKS